MPDCGSSACATRIMSRLRCITASVWGLNYIEDLCDRVFILPAKFPMFLPDTIQRMMGSRAMAACPVYNGKRGHPVLVSKAAIPSLLVYHGREDSEGPAAAGNQWAAGRNSGGGMRGIIMAVESDEDCALGSLGREKLAVYPQVQLTLSAMKGFSDLRQPSSCL